MIKKLFQVPPGIERRHYRFYTFINFGYLLSLAIHGTNVILFHTLHIRPLVVHNIISIGIFVVCIVLNRRGVFFLPLSLAILEFVSHAVFCTYYLGWDSGYPHYLFFLAVSAYLAPAGRKLVKAILVGFVCLSFIALFYYGRLYPPAFSVPSTIITVMNIVNLGVIFSLLGLLSFYYRNAADVAEDRLEKEFRRSEGLLHNILPDEIAEELKKDGTTRAVRFEQCTVLFADMVGFTALAERLAPEELVSILNRVFTRFDDIVDRHGLEKIKTIGDSYMVASGLPVPREDHAEAAARCALDMIAAMDSFDRETELGLAIRVGINSGPVVAGVIGKKKFTYDLWGDSVNLASRMEYHGLPGEIQVTESSYHLLCSSFTLVKRGRIIVKGKGEMHTYLLKNEKGDA